MDTLLYVTGGAVLVLLALYVFVTWWERNWHL